MAKKSISELLKQRIKEEKINRNTQDQTANLSREQFKQTRVALYPDVQPVRKSNTNNTRYTRDTTAPTYSVRDDMRDDGDSLVNKYATKTDYKGDKNPYYTAVNAPKQTYNSYGPLGADITAAKQRSENKKYLDLTQTEARQYNYLFGKYGRKAAEDYINNAPLRKAQRDADFETDVDKMMGSETRDNYTKLQTTARNDINNPYVKATRLADNYFSKPNTSKTEMDEQVKNWMTYTTMTDDEKNRYNYLYAKQGRKAAEKYHKSIVNKIELRNAEDFYKNAHKGSVFDNPVMNTAGQIYGGIEGGIADSTIGVANWLTGNKNPRRKSYAELAAQVKRSDPENTKAENLAYDIGGGIGNMLPSIALTQGASGLGLGAELAGKAGQVAFGLQAGGRGYNEAIEQGYNSDQANKFALQQSIDEYVTGRLLNGVNAYGGGHLRKWLGNTRIAQAAADGVKGFVSSPYHKEMVGKAMQVLGDMGSEAAQEFLQNYTEKVSRNLILNENNKITLADPEAWYSALVGGLTAGVMNVPGYVLNRRTTNNMGNITPGELADMTSKLPAERQGFLTDEGYEAANKARVLSDEVGVRANKGLMNSQYRKGLAMQYLTEATADLNDDYIPPAMPDVQANKQAKTTPINPLNTMQVQNANVENTNINDQIERLARSQGIRVSSIQERAKQFGQDTAKTYIQNFDRQGTVPVFAYDEGFKAAYNAGRYGGKLTNIDTPSYHMLNIQQQEAAYEAGVKDRAFSLKENEYVQGTEKQGGLTETSRPELEHLNKFLNKTGELTGLNFKVVDRLPYDANGMYNRKSGTVSISLNAENINAAVAHEVSHFIKDYSPEHYAKFQDMAVNALAKNKNTSFEELVAEYAARYAKTGTATTREAIIDEITNDSTAHFLNDEKFINEFIKEDKTLPTKIIDFFNDVIEAINGLISKVTNNKAANALRENKKAYEKAREMWLTGLDRAGIDYKAGKEVVNSGEKLFSIKTDSNGEQVAVINTKTFSKNTKDLKASIAQLIKQHIGDYYTIIKNGSKIYIGNDFPGEYTYSKTAQNLRKSNMAIKGNIAHNMEDMIKIATNETWEANKKAKHAVDAKNGWYRYDSKVALPVLDGQKNIVSYQIYDVELLVRHDNNGKKYLYDVMNIKKSTATLLPPAKQVSNKNAAMLSNESITQAGQGVNDNFLSLKLNSNINTKKLLSQNEKLRNANAELKRQLKLTKNYVPNMDTISQISDSLLQSTDSTYSKEDLNKNLEKIYKYIGTHKGDFTGEVVEIAASLSKDILNESSEQSEVTDSEAFEMAQDIFAEYLTARANNSTFADKKKAELIKAKNIYAAKIKAVKESLKGKYTERINKIKAKNLEQKEAAKERQAVKKTGDMLLKQARMLAKMKGLQQFEEAKQALIGDLDLKSKNMTAKTRLNLTNLMGQVSDLKANDPDFITSKGIEEKLARLNKKQIGDFSRAEMLELTQAIVELRHLQKTINKTIGEGKQRAIAELGTGLIKQMKAVKGVKVGTIGAAINNFATSMLDTKRAFNKLSGYQDDSILKQLGDELNKGQLKESTFKMKATQMFNEVVKDKDFVNSLKKQNITIIDDSEKKTTISKAMRIALYLHSLNQDNLRHIANGGVIVPNERLYKKGMYAEAYGQGATKISLTPTQIKSITDSMTEQEKEFAKVAYKFFNETTKEAINETSTQLDGYEKAIVDDYFPIKTDRNFNRIDVSGLIKNGTIEGMGMLKERVEAKNPVLLEDVTDVIMRQINNTAKYNGLAIPVRNFNKVYNFTSKGYESSVKKAISDVWGFNANRYIEKILSDIQGGGKTQFSTIGKIRGKFASATLGLNIGVAMKQAASYPTAAARLGWAPLAKALLKGGKNGHILSGADVKLINKYTPLYWLRSQGNVNPEFGYISQQSPTFNHGGIAEKAAGFFNWIQKADLATVGRLWYASEYYVNDKYQNLKKGTEEYYKQVAEVFNEVVEETQPNYSTMQRPDILRSDSELVRSLTMFMTQRLQNFGILEDSYNELLAKKKQYKAEQNKENMEKLRQVQQRFRNAATSQVISSATISAMTILANLLLYRVKDYRDENGDIAQQKLIEQFTSGFLSSVLGNVVGGSEAFNAFEAIRTGNRPYDINVPAVQAVNDLYSDSIKFGKELQKAFTGDTPLKEKAARLKASAIALADSLSMVSGVPVRNTRKMIDGLIKHTQDIQSNEFGSFMRGNDLKPEMFYNRAFNRIYVEGDYNEFIKDYNRAVIREKNKEKVDREIKKRLQDTEEVHAIAQSIIDGDTNKAKEIRESLESKGFRAKLAPLLTNAIKAEVEKIQSKVEKSEESVEKKKEISEDYDISKTDNDLTELKDEKLANWISKGGDTETYLLFKLKTKNVKADTDENGKAIAGSKKKKIEEIINNMEISEDMKDLLYEEMNYKKKEPTEATKQEQVKNVDSLQSKIDKLPPSDKKQYDKYISLGGTPELFIKHDPVINEMRSDRDSNGKEIKAKKKKVIEYIDGLPISYEEKDKLYLTYYSNKTMPDWTR